MWRGAVRYSVFSGVLVLLSGCGLFDFEQREPWRDEAEQACLAAKAVKVSAYVEPAREIDGPGACGMLRPFRVSAVADGTVGLSSTATLACPIIPVVDQLGGRGGAARGGALLRLAGGRAEVGLLFLPGRQQPPGRATLRARLRQRDGRDGLPPRRRPRDHVSRGWRGQPREQDFLREVFVGSCQHFTTVLGPGSDAFHYDHFHLDLARHARGRTVCKPVIKFEPRLPAVTAARGQITPRVAAEAPASPMQAQRPALPGGRPLRARHPRAYSAAAAPTRRPARRRASWTRARVLRPPAPVRR